MQNQIDGSALLDLNAEDLQDLLGIDSDEKHPQVIKILAQIKKLKILWYKVLKKLKMLDEYQEILSEFGVSTEQDNSRDRSSQKSTGGKQMSMRPRLQSKIIPQKVKISMASEREADNQIIVDSQQRALSEQPKNRIPGINSLLNFENEMAHKTLKVSTRAQDKKFEDHVQEFLTKLKNLYDFYIDFDQIEILGKEDELDLLRQSTSSE